MKQFIWHLLTLTSDNIFFHSVYLYLNFIIFWKYLQYFSHLNHLSFFATIFFFKFSEILSRYKNSHNRPKTNRSDGSKDSVVRFAMLPPQGAAV